MLFLSISFWFSQRILAGLNPINPFLVKVKCHTNRGMQLGMGALPEGFHV